MPTHSHAPTTDEPARTEAHTRLDLLETVPYDDPAHAQGPADELLTLALEHDWPDVEMRARLVLADCLGRDGGTSAAGSVVNTVHSWATEHGDAHVLARAERLLVAFYTHIGDQPAALEHAVRAVELLPTGAVDRTRADHLLALAAALARTQSFDAARDRYETVLQIADRTADIRLRLATLNNLAYVEYLASRPEAALGITSQMQLLAEREGIPLRWAQCDTIARAQFMLGQYAAAIRTLTPVLDGEAGPTSEPDEIAETLLTMAQAQRMLGSYEDALSSLERAAQLCDDRDLEDVRVRVMQESAHLYAAQGRYRQAFEQHCAFHEASEALYDAERDARARTLQAVFETEEALQNSRRFREMSLRDPLTGLYNRRYIDDRLPALIGRSRDERTWLSVALVDLDHFKRVNDIWSHDVGDEVLRQITTLLSVAAGDGFAARIGGEEFLIVMPGTDHRTAFDRCEQLRKDVRDYPWSPIVGQLPIRVSIGLVSSPGGRYSMSELLSEADRRLYLSKGAGRDRVTGD